MALCMLWGAIGFSGGVIFATTVLTISAIIDDHLNEKERIKCGK